MITPETADTAPDASTSARGWVWHSTDDSITAGQISVLSVVETFCALGLYGWLAFHFEFQWWLLISAVAAPILLLRSPKSTAVALSLLRHYWENNEGSILDHSKKRQNINKQEEILIRVMLLLTILLMLYAIYAGMNGIIQQPTRIIAYILFMFPTLLLLFSHPSTVLDSKIFDQYLFFSVFFGLFTVGFNEKTIGIIIMTIPYILSATNHNQPHSIFLRCFFIRIKSVIMHLGEGFRNLPKNWREISFVTDSTVFPELIPRAKEISVEMDLFYLLKQLISNKNYRIKLTSLMHLIMWYPPTLMWRWSLKATLWLWFPLALLLRSPFEGKSLEEVRDIAAIRINGLGKWLPSLTVVVILWLNSGYFSPEDIKSWAELGSDNISKLLDKLLTIAPPPPGLRHWALWLVCGLTIIMWWLSDRLQIMHKKVLEEEDALDGLTAERRNLFFQRAHRLERWHTARVVSFILLGYSFALHLANQWYPQELARFIPAWVIGWL